MRLRKLLAVYVTSLLVGCPPPPPPVTTPAEPPPQAPPPALASPLVAQSSAPLIVIKQADLFGKLVAKQGAVVTIRALLVTSKLRPRIGQHAQLACAPLGGDKDSDWLPLADVEIKGPLDDAGQIEVRLVNPGTSFVLPNKQAPTPVPKNTRLRLRWEYE